MITRFVLLAATVRKYVAGSLRRRLPLGAAALLALPVKTLAALNAAGVVAVIFASVQHVRLDTFGAACGAVSVLLVTMSLRVNTDEEVATTFAGIMTGTLRQRIRALHDGLLYGGAGVAAVGLSVVGAERVADSVAGAAPPPSYSDAAAVAGIGALALQVVCASPWDADDPAHDAYARLAHDVLSIAQIAGVWARGVHTAATASVVFALIVAHAANAAQLDAAAQRLPAGEEEAPEPSTPKELPADDGVERAFV